MFLELTVREIKSVRGVVAGYHLTCPEVYPGVSAIVRELSYATEGFQDALEQSGLAPYPGGIRVKTGGGPVNVGVPAKQPPSSRPTRTHREAFAAGWGGAAAVIAVVTATQAHSPVASSVFGAAAGVWGLEALQGWRKARGAGRGQVSGPEFVEALVIRPGDHILLRMPTGTTVDRMLSYKAGAEDRFPDNKVSIVACEQIAVYRPDTVKVADEVHPYDVPWPAGPYPFGGFER